MREIVLTLAVLLGAAPAWATPPDFECSVNDQNLSLTLSVGLGYIPGNIHGLRIELEIRAKRDMPSNLRKRKFRADDLVLHWFYYGDLKLMLRSDDTYFVIELQKRPEGRDSYKLTIDDARTVNRIELRGSAKCGD
jgi:hypothetical protein